VTTSTVASLTIEQVPLDRLRPDPANPRRISEDELDSLERSLRQFGFVQPVLARREDQTAIGGHQRLVAARRLGLTKVPVIWLDISLEQARLLGLALNKISGSWDDALLARLLADLAAVQADWIRGLRDLCREAGVAFFFKQWGGRTPKANGRELDAQTWDEWPVGDPVELRLAL